MTLAQFFAAQTVVRAEPVNVEAVEKVLAAFVAALDPRERIRTVLLAEMGEVDPEMPETGIETEDRRRVLSDVDALEKGNWALGHSDPRLTQFVGGPGINHLTYLIQQCRNAIDRENALRAIAWPVPMRYIGRPGTMTFDGQKLRRGDVVRLSRSQAQAWADKFEMAGDEQPEPAPIS